MRKSLPFRGRAVDILDLFCAQPYVFLLESSLKHRERGRFSFIGFDPFKVVASDDDVQLQDLRRKFRPYLTKRAGREFPLPGGMVGFLSYRSGQSSLSKGAEEPDIPFYCFGFYDTVITIDHWKKRLIIHATGLPEKDSRRRQVRARRRIAHIVNKIKAGTARTQKEISFNGRSRRKAACRSNFSKQEYVRAVRRALGYIKEGDIYQVNLSQRFCADLNGNGRVDPVRLYAMLRELSPSCFGGYFNAGDYQIISSSPERFMCLRGDRVETRPMKGTRPRGTTRRDDEHLLRELWRSPKEKAELLMVTDLERNDLGQVCRYGSVKVKEMRSLERYRTVYQATSTVEGRLQQGKDCFDVLSACSPGGSITGCPKIRAMQIIDELEPSARQVYTGSMGYINFAGDMDFNILIRTLLISGRKVYFHVGGGIVADSDPEAEYIETLVKARAMQDCLNNLLNVKSAI